MYAIYKIYININNMYNIYKFIIPLLCYFTILGQKNVQNMPRYYTVEQGKQSDKMAEQNLVFGGKINPLFDGLTYNTSGHFAHCSYFPRPFGPRKNTTQLTKISAHIIC